MVDHATEKKKNMHGWGFLEELGIMLLRCAQVVHGKTWEQLFYFKSNLVIKDNRGLISVFSHKYCITSTSSEFFFHFHYKDVHNS